MAYFNINMDHIDTASLQILLPELDQIPANATVSIIRIDEHDVVGGPAVALVVDVLSHDENRVADQFVVFGAHGVDRQHPDPLKVLIGDPIWVERYVLPHGNFAPVCGNQVAALFPHIS